MVHPFIYNGVIYRFTESLENGLEIVGDPVGGISEWPETDDYVDGHSTATGTYYTVKGKDPSVMLCMKCEDGSVKLYTRTKGAKLYEDRLQLSGNVTEVLGQKYEDRESNVGKMVTVDPTAAQAFLEVIDAGTLVRTDSIPIQGQGRAFKEKYRMFYRRADDRTVEMRVLEGGYVIYPGILDVAVKIPEESLETLNDSLDGSLTAAVIPEMDISLKKPTGKVIARMIQFFIYQGGIYRYTQTIHGNNMVGKLLGIATGLIDEWTPVDGYVDNAGSMLGNYYSVNGFDPSFMLCMTYDTGDTELYVRNSGISLTKGSEIFENRLRLSENLLSATAQSYEDWNNGGSSKHLLSDETARLFLEALDNGRVVLTNSIPVQEDELLFDHELYHLCYTRTDGVTAELRVLDNGYVVYTGIYEAAVKVAEKALQSLINVLGI